ncbi:hypothetical protein [Roseicella frigidaeris]|uniref:Uncharacterized protein n=1 Tax=Roseicella frigidaeris TaxID=2230885 RepID=A0A327M0L6_9PROT|nr:hypothetical protein [Roseicella frigidaeris]RAI55904.1 hypothetical protein DOO78_23430 [Roseicella frigidaeris]
MKRLFLAAGLTIAAAAPASADWEYTRWGMTAEQVISASGGRAHAMPASRRYRDDAGHFEITVDASDPGPPRTSIGFQFGLPSGGLQCVLINATGSDADGLLARFLERYGAPDSDDSLGPTRMLEWHRADTIELTANAAPKAAVVNQCQPGRS